MVRLPYSLPKRMGLMCLFIIRNGMKDVRAKGPALGPVRSFSRQKKERKTRNGSRDMARTKVAEKKKEKKKKMNTGKTI